MAEYETSLATLEPQATGESPENVTDDRRRPGRSDHVNPTLIPLLRIAPGVGLSPEDNADLAHDYEELAPAAAIAAIVLLSVLLWGVIGLIVWSIVY